MDYPTKWLSTNEKININSDEIYYFINYYPKRKIENLPTTDKKYVNYKRINDFKNYNRSTYGYFYTCLKSHFSDFGNEEWIACSIPGHDQTSATKNHMDAFLTDISLPNNIHPVVGLIIRNKAMPKKHDPNVPYGQRTVQKDLDSYKIGNSRNISGQNIIIFDDITTSGCSLIAARQFLKTKGAKRVVCIVLGKTIEESYGGNIDWLF